MRLSVVYPSRIGCRSVWLKGTPKLLDCYLHLSQYMLLQIFKITNYVGSCFAIAIRVDFRQSFGGSISITAQCIETQFISIESSRKDLQIMCGHFYVRSILHGVIYVIKCQRPSNCFSSCSSFSWPLFGEIGASFPEKLPVGSQ